MLKFSCIITGAEYNSLIQDTPYSRRKVIILATAMLIPILLWLTQGYLLTTVVFGGSWKMGLVTSLVFGLLIFFLERVIVIADNSISSTIFRGILGLCFALIGAVVADECIFHADIEQKLEEYLKSEKSKAYASAITTDSLNLANLVLKQNELNIKWIEALESAEKEADGSGGTLNKGVGEITKTKLKIAGKFERELLKTKEEVSDLTTKMSDYASNAAQRAEQKFSAGLLIRMKALWELISESAMMKFVWSIVTALLLMLEMFVLVTKWNIKKSHYDYKVESIEQIGKARLKRITDISQHFHDPLEDYTNINGGPKRALF